MVRRYYEWNYLYKLLFWAFLLNGFALLTTNAAMIKSSKSDVIITEANPVAAKGLDLPPSKTFIPFFSLIIRGVIWGLIFILFGNNSKRNKHHSFWVTFSYFLNIMCTLDVLNNIGVIWGLIIR